MILLKYLPRKMEFDETNFHQVDAGTGDFGSFDRWSRTSFPIRPHL
jgi:hypothetical protein